MSPEGICYYPFSQVSERNTVSISSDHVLVYQIFLGWNILWVSNDIYGLVIDRVNKEYISDYNPIRDGLYSPIYDAVEIPGCVWPRFLYVTS